MTDGPETFWDLVSDLDTKVDEAIDKIVETANHAADKLEDAANGVLATLGRLIPGESEAEKAIKKWNNELAPEIQKGIDNLASNVASAVGDLAGEPKTLIEHSQKFIAAKATLYTQNTLAQDVTNLGNTWSGPAYRSYSTVATQQSDALLALANNLQTGGELTRDGADRILQLWIDLLDNFVDYASQAISVIGGFADVGKVLGAWISAIADAFAVIVKKIGDLAILLSTFFKNQITQASLGWEKLATGTDGLANNHWPIISESTSDTMNDPANWPQPAAS